MQEIEIKIQITPQKLEELKCWLTKYASFVGEQHQRDYYFDNPAQSFFIYNEEGVRDALRYVRLREAEDGNYLCYKDWYVDAKTGQTTHCDEFETKVDSAEIARKFLKGIGYTDVTVVEKHRQTYLYQIFEVVIDSVSSLGTFVEVEIKKPSGDVLKDRQRIFEFFKQLGYETVKTFSRGYVCMAWNPSHDFAEVVCLS